MPILQWRCAHGEAPAISLACAPTLALATLDDSVDSNLVFIKGEGLIRWFGEGPPILKRVMFGPGIMLDHNPPQLSLLSCRLRQILRPAVGLYACDGAGHWSEIHFTETGVRELSRRIELIEARLDDIEWQLDQLATQQRERIDA